MSTLLLFVSGLLIGILLVELKNKNLYEKIVQDMSDSEVEAMNNFCTRGDANFQYDENDLQDHLRLAEFTLLLALRVGTVSLETVSKIKQRFQTLDRRHEARISYDDVAYNNDTMVSLIASCSTIACLNIIVTIIIHCAAPSSGEEARFCGYFL